MKKKFDMWCAENEGHLDEMCKLVDEFLNNSLSYNHPIRHVHFDIEKLHNSLRYYVYNTSNNSQRYS